MGIAELRREIEMLQFDFDQRLRAYEEGRDARTALQIKARRAVKRACRNGTLKRPKVCVECRAEGKIEGHHFKGYEPQNWLTVEWLCKACHGRRFHEDGPPTSIKALIDAKTSILLSTREPGKGWISHPDHGVVYVDGFYNGGGWFYMRVSDGRFQEMGRGDERAALENVVGSLTRRANSARETLAEAERDLEASQKRLTEVREGRSRGESLVFPPRSLFRCNVGL